MVDLGTFGGASSSAAAVIDNGFIVGSSGTTSGESHATLWKPAPPPPIAQASILRIAHVMPDAAVDSVDAAQPMPATRTWTTTLWNSGSTVLPAPTISVDGSSQTFVPPLAFPLSATGADLNQIGHIPPPRPRRELGPLARRHQRLLDGIRRHADDVTGDNPRRRRDADRDRLGDAARPADRRRRVGHPGRPSRSRLRRGRRRPERRSSGRRPGWPAEPVRRPRIRRLLASLLPGVEHDLHAHVEDHGAERDGNRSALQADGDRVHRRAPEVPSADNGAVDHDP